MTNVINAPAEIWLNYCDDHAEAGIDHSDCGDVSWSEDGPLLEISVRYVHAGLHEALQSQLAEAQEQLNHAERAHSILEIAAATLVQERDTLQAEIAALRQEVAAAKQEARDQKDKQAACVKEIARLSALVPRWIPVSEELPEIGVEVFVADALHVSTDCLMDDDPVEWDEDSFEWTHWMPLLFPAPVDADQPPQAGEQEKRL